MEFRRSRRRALRLSQTRGHRLRHPVLPALIWLVSVSFAGCSNSNFDLSADDVVGTWRAGNGLSTQVDLVEDGTFTSVGWPARAQCDPGEPITASELQGTETRDLSGTWEENDGGSLNALTLTPGSDQCSTLSINANVRSEGGVTYMCVLTGESLTGPPDNFLTLYLGEPPKSPDPGACFNYN